MAIIKKILRKIKKSKRVSKKQSRKQSRKQSKKPSRKQSRKQSKKPSRKQSKKPSKKQSSKRKQKSILINQSGGQINQDDIKAIIKKKNNKLIKEAITLKDDDDDDLVGGEPMDINGTKYQVLTVDLNSEAYNNYNKNKDQIFGVKYNGNEVELNEGNIYMTVKSNIEGNNGGEYVDVNPEEE